MVRPSARRTAPALRRPAIVDNTMPVTRRRYATGISTDFKAAQLAAKFGNRVSKLFMELPSGEVRRRCVEIQCLVGRRCRWRWSPLISLARGDHSDNHRENYEGDNESDHQFPGHWLVSGNCAGSELSLTVLLYFGIRSQHPP